VCIYLLAISRVVRDDDDDDDGDGASDRCRARTWVIDLIHSSVVHLSSLSCE
jgi:hypothetical protein